MSKIIKALKQAVRYAKGDKSAGKLTTICVRRVTVLHEVYLGGIRIEPGEYRIARIGDVREADPPF